MSSGITRRQALQGLGAALVAPKLVGCSKGPGSISTIVVLMMENRSYDHYLGARSLLESRAGDGLTAGMSNPDMAGVQRPIYRETVQCVAEDPPHGWNPSRVQFAAGAMDGFMRAFQDSYGASAPPMPMGYFARADLPVTWALADGATSCDRWFGSVLGPTWPNRYYLHAAQSFGLMGNLVQPEPPFDTIYHRLDAAGVPWKYYYSDLPFLAAFKNVNLDRFKAVRYDFFDDAAAGTLPPVVMLNPGFTYNDNHPPHHPMMGEQFIGVVYDALAASPQWPGILFVVTYDENGGFYDHVRPPTAPDERAAQGFDQLGFRVPTIVAGPWVKQGHVSSVVYDHTSVLKHIEGMFGLAPLTMRDAAAKDLSDCIDADRLARGEPAAPLEIPKVTLDPSTLPGVCFSKRDEEPCDLEKWVDAGNLPPELDLRDQIPDFAAYLNARSRR